MNNFIRTIKLIKFKRFIRWTAIISLTLAFTVMLTLSVYAVASHYDSSLNGLRLQSPIQSPLRFEHKETFINAPRNTETAPTINETPKTEGEPVVKK